jgi:chromate transport protein ChrA
MAQVAGILAMCLFTLAAIIALIGLISVLKQINKLK